MTGIRMKQPRNRNNWATSTTAVEMTAKQACLHLYMTVLSLPLECSTPCWLQDLAGWRTETPLSTKMWSCQETKLAGSIAPHTAQHSGVTPVKNGRIGPNIAKKSIPSWASNRKRSQAY